MKRHLITGGSAGIGSALVKILTDQEDFVINIDVNEPQAADNAQGAYYHANLEDIQDVTRACERITNDYREINSIICVAGVGYVDRLSDLSAAQFDKQVISNLHITYYTIKTFLPLLLNGGSIVTVSSVSSYGVPGASIGYSAAKAGIIGLTKNLAYELAPQKIRVNCVVPGSIDTELLNRLSTNTERAMMAAFTPLGRLGQPKDVADVIKFFISEDARFVTGVVLPVDGGLSLSYRLNLS